MRTSSLILPFLLGMLIILTALPISVPHPTAGATITVDDDGGADHTSIQKAIDDANDGDVIRVYEGTYEQRISIDKPLTIIGNGTTNTTIDGGGAGNVVTIKTDGVTISGFKIISSGSEWTDAGIRVDANGARIFNVNCTDDENGIYIDEDCVNTKVWNSICTNNNRHGIYLEAESGKSNITGNQFTNNDQDGIHLSYSDENRITENNCSNNDRSGIYQQYSHKNHFVNNSCNDNELDGLQMFFCSDITVINSTFNNNRYGIYLRYDSDSAKDSSDNIIENNTYSGNDKEIKEEIDDIIGFFKACIVIIVIVVAIVAFTSYLMRSGSGKKVPGVTISPHAEEPQDEEEYGSKDEENEIEKSGDKGKKIDDGENDEVNVNDEGDTMDDGEKKEEGEIESSENEEPQDEEEREDERNKIVEGEREIPHGSDKVQVLEKSSAGSENGEVTEDRMSDIVEESETAAGEENDQGIQKWTDDTMDHSDDEDPHVDERAVSENDGSETSAPKPRPQLIIEDLDQPTDYDDESQGNSDEH